MIIEFRTQKLRRCFEEQTFAQSEWGKMVARHYVKAIGLLRAAQSVHDLKAFVQYRPHPLKGDRQGAWAMALARRAWLIFTPYQGEEGTVARVEQVDPQHYNE